MASVLAFFWGQITSFKAKNAKSEENRLRLKFDFTSEKVSHPNLAHIMLLNPISGPKIPFSGLKSLFFGQMFLFWSSPTLGRHIYGT
ncbi:MAG: hypothetical protein GY739_07720 [Mesoflavibacter sp.]|nr:hypothetical protein [Mesoflavibacter sp.]